MGSLPRHACRAECRRRPRHRPSTLGRLIEQADTSAEGVLARVRAAVPVLPLTPPDGVAVIGDMATAKLTS